jgi:hypothetical protein
MTTQVRRVTLCIIGAAVTIAFIILLVVAIGTGGRGAGGGY